MNDNKKKYDRNLYILAGLLFMAAGLLQDMAAFYIIGCVMFVLAFNSKKNSR